MIDRPPTTFGALEVGQLLRLQGGRPETAYGLAGVGDMYVTSAGGRNIRMVASSVPA